MACSNRYEKAYVVDLIRGDTWSGLKFTVSRVDAVYNEATVKWQIRNAPDGDIVLTKNIMPESQEGDTIVFTCSLTSEETRLFNNAVLQSDVQISIPGGSDEADDVRTPIAIKFRVTKDLTR